MNNENITDGVYVELFVIKDGIRYTGKVVKLEDMTTTLTSSLLDGIESLVKP